jgi:hypothetical protein
MRTLMTAALYFGGFLAIGWSAKQMLGRWMASNGAELDEVQKQAGGRRGRRRVFLLGAWRTED